MSPLHRHISTEEQGLCSYALQALSCAQWDAVEGAQTASPSSALALDERVTALPAADAEA